MRMLIFIFLLLFSCVAFGQTSCDSLSPALIKKFDAYPQKKFDKLKHKNNLDPETAFNIATYFREKNNAAYKEWYLVYIDLNRKMHEKRKANCNKGTIPHRLFYVGVAYYYTGDQSQANSWFLKAMKASYKNKCLDYYYEQTQATLDIK